MRLTEDSRQKAVGSRQRAEANRQRAAAWGPGLLAAYCLLPPAYCLLPARSAAAEQVQKHGPAEVLLDAASVAAGQVEMRLADELGVTFRVEGRSSLEVEPLPAATPAKDWEVVQRQEPQRLPLADGRVRWQQTFHLAPTRAGEVLLPLVPLRFRDAAGARWKQVAWQPTPVRVTTEIVQPDLSELRGMPPAEEPPPVPAWWLPLGRLGAALILLGVLLAGWQLWRRRRRREPAVPPDQWALAEIDRAAAGPLDTEATVEQFFTRLSDVLRSYLEQRFQLPAPEQTTSEFLETMRRAPQLPPASQEVLREFLQRCDLVKFARAQPAPAECQAAARVARSFVEQTRELPLANQTAGAP